jgi:hypothetical protein
MLLVAVRPTYGFSAARDGRKSLKIREKERLQSRVTGGVIVEGISLPSLAPGAAPRLIAIVTRAQGFLVGFGFSAGAYVMPQARNRSASHSPP